MNKNAPGLSLRIILIGSTRWAANINTRMVYPFLSAFARGLGVDLVAISLVLMVRSLVATLVPFVSSAIDARGRKTGMLLGVGIFTLGVGLSIFWHNYIVFFITQCVAFFGTFIFVSATQAYLGDEVPYERRGTAIAFTEMGWALSFIIGMPLVSLLIGWFGWWAPFPALAILGVTAFLLLARFIPRQADAPRISVGMFSGLRQVLTSPVARVGLAMSFLMTTSNEVVNVVFGVWMESSFGLQLAALGMASAVIGVAELCGEIFSAGLADRLGKKRVIQGGMILMALSMLLLPWLGRSLWGALAGLFLFYLTFEFTIVCSLPFMTEIMPAARATYMGANVASFSLGRALGALLAPLLFSLGFMANTLVSVIFLAGAFMMLSRLHVAEKRGEQKGANA